MDQSKKKRVSSGIKQLDSLLGDLFIGDNVLWYEETGSFSSAFCVELIRYSLSLKKPVVYVSFDRSPKNVVTFLGPLAESQNFTLLDCFTNGKGDRSEVFAKFYEKDGAQYPYQVIKVNDPANPSQVWDAIYGLHGNLTGDIRFIIDSLTGMQDLWNGEEQVTKFYARTCPRLYELDTIAYWLIAKHAHSSRLKANINKIAQVVIDLTVKNGASTLKIVKAEKRNSPYLHEEQIFTCEQGEISFNLPRTQPGRHDLGGRIKAIRKKQGLSQKELAEKAGFTPSSISQIEKNLIYPSIPALFRLAESLSISVAAFFDSHPREPAECVFRSAEGGGEVVLKNAKSGFTGKRLLPPGIGEDDLEPFLVTVEPRKKIAEHFFSHKGIEAGYLLKGALAIWVNGIRREVAAGDFIYLAKDTPEMWENCGDEAAEMLWLKVQ